MTKSILLAGVAGLAFIPVSYAQDISIGSEDAHAHHNHAEHDHSLAPSAPISIMGDHLHPKGEWMVSYRFQHMDMSGNQQDGSSISNDDIVTSVANRFAGTAGQPSTLRVVPTEMDMNMHMFSAMYGVSDWLTVMAMGMWLEKDMSHVTYAGGAGTTVLGTFDTDSEGWGDTVVGGLVRLHEDNMHSVHANLGLSLPTGSIKEEGDVLAPNGLTPRLRLPYAMQLGSGTYDFHPGLTYAGHKDAYSWGAQYKAEIRLEDENSQGYAWGDKHSLTAWGGYRWSDVVRSSLRLSASTQEAIDGIDTNIVAPVQTADPDNYGGDVIEAGIGLNLKGNQGWSIGHELGVELSVPLYQDLNGVQLEQDYALTLGWKKAF